VENGSQIPLKPYWKTILEDIALNPEKHSSLVYTRNADFVVIFDSYTKSKKHLLVLPRKLIKNLSYLKKEDIILLTKMKELGMQVQESFLKQDSSLKFRVGFHAIPTLRQLHMHIISQDFDSDCLKNKKHWNSFTTKFFIDIDVAIKMLKENANIKFDEVLYERYLQQPLRCHICHNEFKFIPQLKLHIRECYSKNK